MSSWLGLFHTFQGGCEEQNGGDQVVDTAPQKRDSFGCPSSKNTCGGPPEPIHNFMVCEKSVLTHV